MAISKLKKHESSKPFTMILWEVTQSIKNPDSLAIWAYLQSLPEDWDVSETQLRKHFGIGRDRYLAAMRCLKDLRLYKYVRLKSDKNNFTGGYYHVYETPYLQESTLTALDTDITVNDSLTINDSIKLKEKETVNTSSPNKSIVNKKTIHSSEKLLKEKEGKIGKSNSVKDIMKKQENALEGRIEELSYLKDLKPYQILNPKEFKGSSHKGKKLTRIATDVYNLFTHTCKKVNPEMGIVAAPTMKEVAMMGSFMKKIGGDLELLLLIANNWFTFKTAVEAQHATKIKKTYPNLPIMVKYADIASSEGFLGKLGTTTQEESGVGKEWDL